MKTVTTEKEFYRSAEIKEVKGRLYLRARFFTEELRFFCGKYMSRKKIDEENIFVKLSREREEEIRKNIFLTEEIKKEKLQKNIFFEKDGDLFMREYVYESDILCEYMRKTVPPKDGWRGYGREEGGFFTWEGVGLKVTADKDVEIVRPTEENSKIYLISRMFLTRTLISKNTSKAIEQVDGKSIYIFENGVKEIVNPRYNLVPTERLEEVDEKLSRNYFRPEDKPSIEY